MSFKFIAVLAIGLGVGMAGGVAIVLHDRWGAGINMLRKILITIPFALLALAMISVPIILQKTIGESAEAHVARFGYGGLEIRGTRIPCAGGFDVGFGAVPDRRPENRGPRPSLPGIIGRLDLVSIDRHDGGS